MSDKFNCCPIDHLLKWILEEEKQGEIFGIRKELFFVPQSGDVFKMKRYGQDLETPIGVAAGPHTQLSQNIISAWLTGARYMELKTVQTLDELEVTKPCIDMTDEGYNCEWSQELKLEQSFNEYLNAWIILHILKDKFKTEVLQSKFDEDKDIKEKQKVLERKCQTIIRNQGRTMENIISIETDIVQGRTDEKIARGIINNLHDEIEDYKEELQKTETELDTLLSRKEWLDWISHYSESLKIESQKEEDKKRWVEGLVKKIVVHSEYGLNREEKEVQVGHSFDIHFKMKIVNDQLVYKDESNKKLGYEIKDGKSVLKLDEVNFNYLRGSKKKAGL